MPKILTVEEKRAKPRGTFSVTDEERFEKNKGNPLRLYDNLKLAYPQSQVLELMRAEEELKLLKTENTRMLSQLEANNVELRMLRAAVDAFKLIEKDAGYRADVLDIELKKCQ